MKKGFTLIEILIVVAIIGILASVVLVGLGPVQKQGRDTRRISDLRQVQAGLELYFNKFGKYPPTPTDWASFQQSLIGADIGVNNVPTDPRNTAPLIYKYATDPDQTKYMLSAVLEDTGNPALKSSSSSTISSFSCAAPTYCVSL